MIAGALLLTLLGAPPPTEVIILSKYHPTALKIVDGRCLVRSRRVETIKVESGRLLTCRGTRCKTSPGPLKLRCKKPAQLQVEGIEPRTYGRRFKISLTSKQLRIIATLDEDHYVQGVVNSELSGAPQSAKKAQAVLARTYLRYAQLHPRHRDAPVCDLTHCQVFRNSGPLKLKEGRILTRANGSPTPVFFHSTCGGHTTAAADVWPGQSTGHDLVGIDDIDPNTDRDWCGRSRHYRWITEFSAKKMQVQLQKLVKRPLELSSLVFEKKDTLGLQWRVGDRHRTKTISGRKVHRQLARSLGWGAVKSSRFKAVRAGDTYRLHGEGLGHGVGLCQTGAMARSKAGHSAKQILKAYFPKLRLAP